MSNLMKETQMKYARCICGLLWPALVVLTSDGAIAGTKSDRPNDFSLEILGRSLLYSLTYQHTIGERLGIEGAASIVNGFHGRTVSLFSGGVKGYLKKSDAAPYIGIGVVTVSPSTRSLDTGAYLRSLNAKSYFYLAPGFEYRSEGGFLLRGTVYVLFGSGNSFAASNSGIVVWPGVQIGFAF
jgi:hypothetical protein